jgi:methionyl-tRNA formyltransferase
MNDLRIVFMGTPAFAVASLEALLNANFNVVAVVTAPDKPAGRGRSVKQSALKEYALKNKLTVLQPSNLKSQDFVQSLIDLEVNLQIVVAFRMLPQIVWSLPKYGTFNLHASLLPDYRGAAPINWAIINGEKKTGVTTFFLNENIDEGEIILQKEVVIGENETAGDLHDKLMKIGSAIVIETVELIANQNIILKKQPQEDFKLAPKLSVENCRIDWSKNVDEVYNQVRGLSPYPLAHTLLMNGQEQIKALIFSCTPIITEHTQGLGSISIYQKEMHVFCKNGFVKIDQLKLAGKKLMDTKSLLNGYAILDGAYFE